MTISERILKVLKDRNMTQVEFAKQVGIATSTISEWKKKKTNPTADKIMDICNVLQITPELKTRKRLLRQARRVGLHLMTFN
jgi:transcriptional regulator with XRE-family HTH domain